MTSAAPKLFAATEEKAGSVAPGTTGDTFFSFHPLTGVSRTVLLYCSSSINLPKPTIPTVAADSTGVFSTSNGGMPSASLGAATGALALH